MVLLLRKARQFEAQSIREGRMAWRLVESLCRDMLDLQVSSPKSSNQAAMSSTLAGDQRFIYGKSAPERPKPREMGHCGRGREESTENLGIK